MTRFDQMAHLSGGVTPVDRLRERYPTATLRPTLRVLPPEVRARMVRNGWPLVPRILR